jgi:hypothetical protein
MSWRSLSGQGSKKSVWVSGLALVGSLASCGSRSGLDRAWLDAPDTSALAASPPLAAEAVPYEPERVASVPARDAEPTGCVDIRRRYTSTPPTVLLLIDQSASMYERFGTSTRWDVLRRAIVDPEDGLLAWLEPNANIGLMLYTSQNGYENGGECPIVTRVDVRLGNAARIRAFYADAEPLDGGDTPTGEAIDSAATYLGSVSAGPAKYILLLTDGVPDTCAEPDPQNGFDAAVDAVVRARARGITVRTVGVSPDIARDGLQRMANAGAGKSLDLVFEEDDDAERPLYASTDPRELADQLEGAIGDVRSCTIALGTGVSDARAADGRLTLDGRVLEYDDPNGWSFEDEDTLRINGDACRRILGGATQLEVSFPCEPSTSFDDLR